MNCCFPIIYQHFTFPPATCENPILYLPTSSRCQSSDRCRTPPHCGLTCVFLTANVNLGIFFIRSLAMSFAQSLAGQSRLCPFFKWDALSFQATHNPSICPSRSMLCLSPSICALCLMGSVLNTQSSTSGWVWPMADITGGHGQEEREIGELF